MHNDFLQAFVTNGILGGTTYILFFILISIFILKQVIKNIMFPQNDSVLLVGLFAFYISILVSSLVAYVLFFNVGGSAAIFWLYLGYATYFARNNKAKMLFKKLINKMLLSGVKAVE